MTKQEKQEQESNKPHKKNSFVKKERAPTNNQFYLDNKEFYQACLEYKESCIKATAEGLPKPRISNYIGECLLKIATKVSYSRSFINYKFREDMIGDAVENCLLYFDNFDPFKYKNPFSYFTQIVYYAFLRRIEKEKKRLYGKYKLQQSKRVGHSEMVDIGDHDNHNEFLMHVEEDNDFMRDFVEKYEAKEAKKKAEREAKKNATSSIE